MIRNWNAVVLVAAIAALPACDEGSKAEGKDTPSADAKGDTKEAKATEKKPEKEKVEIVLEEKKDEAFGYSIQIPKGAKELQKNDMAHTYSLPLPGGLYEYNIHLTNAENGDLASLERMATMMGGKELTEKKELEGGGFLVVKKPRMKMVEMFVSKKGKKPVTAKCLGPEGEAKKVQEICTSLKAL